MFGLNQLIDIIREGRSNNLIKGAEGKTMISSEELRIVINQWSFFLSKRDTTLQPLLLLSSVLLQS